MAQATSLNGRAPSEVVDAVVIALCADNELAAGTLVRLEALMRQFAGFVEQGHGLRGLELVGHELVADYLTAPTADGSAPGTSLQYFRRLAVRVLFRTCRQLGMAVGDPSVDAVLPPRSPGSFRPLEDEEVELARAAAVGSPRLARGAAAWALCEATARTGELRGILRSDLDLEGGKVWIGCTPRTAGRWGQLSGWGVRQLARYLADLPEDPELPVLVGGTPGSALAQSSAVGAISQILTHAGLGEAPDVRPSSVAAWAGRRIFEETGRIDVAAQRLGMRSLDRAARFIGWDWAANGG